MEEQEQDRTLEEVRAGLDERVSELEQELEFARNEALKAEHNLEVAESLVKEVKVARARMEDERDGAEERVNELTGKLAERDRRIEKLEHGIEDAMDELKRVV